MEQQIHTALQAAVAVHHLVISNESHLHYKRPNATSHFNITLVSDDFVGASPVKRHQRVYAVLADLLHSIHALALHIYTVDEWHQQKTAPCSPRCFGGSQR